VVKRFGDVAALDGLDLHVDAGEVVGLLGPNGAGKTTAIRVLLGLLRADGGTVTAFGLDVWRRAPAAHRRLAYVPGETALWGRLTGGQTLDLLGRLHGEVDVPYRRRLVERFALDEGRRVAAYSKGNRQKVALIAAFMVRPELLVLDEPTSGLDPLMDAVFREELAAAKARGQAALLSSHVLGEVDATADRVVMLRDGKVLSEGGLGELRALAALRVEARFRDTVPDLRGVPGVDGLQVEGATVRLLLSGPPGPALAALAAAGPERLVCREPSLEELFGARYGQRR
jgi:ABC-2 type transport system ATP-binding protein